MNPSEHPSERLAWVAQATALLDESAQQLDAATLSRLNRARQAALACRRPRAARAWFLPAGLASACALLLAVAVWHAPAPVAGSAPLVTPAAAKASATASASATANGNGFNANDLDMVSGDDSLEFYQDLEFYAWLDAQDLGSDG